MLPRILCLALLLVGCGPTVVNSTICGLQIENGSNGWLDFSQLQEAEDALLANIGNIQDERINSPEKACKLLRYGFFYAKDETDWTDAWGRRVAGITFCEQRLMIVGRPFSGTWHSSSIVHEAIHWLQRCVGTSPDREELGTDEGHRNWTTDGVYRTIDLTNTRL